jgi:hypothetical protein
MLKLLYILFFAGTGLQGCAGPTNAQTQQSDRIGFVRLMITETEVTLLDATSRPGRLKPSRGGAVPQTLAFDVMANGTEVIWSESIEDPLHERVEYVDEEGRLQTRTVQHEHAEVMIRIPVVASRQTINLYRSRGPGKADRSLISTVEVTF